MIDFSRAFRTSPELRRPENLGPHRPACVRGIAVADQSEARKRAGFALLRESEIDALLARRDRIVQFFEKQIAEKGEGMVVCKLEGPLGPLLPNPTFGNTLPEELGHDETTDNSPIFLIRGSWLSVSVSHGRYPA